MRISNITVTAHELNKGRECARVCKGRIINVSPAKRSIHESGVSQDQIVSLSEKTNLNRI